MSKITPNEMRLRANKFVKEWKNETREEAESQSFWTDFFNIFGVDRRKVEIFEEPATRLGNKQGGKIDLFWEANVIIEHKSAGKDLDQAIRQAEEYLHYIEEEKFPNYVLVSNFTHFKIKNLNDSSIIEFPITDLPNKIKHFHFISGYGDKTIIDEVPVNIKAAKLMADLHDTLLANNYTGHKLELFLVRILFILFAEDSLIFEKSLFNDYILNYTNKDGSDIGSKIAELFQVLNTPVKNRAINLNEDLNKFEYINGALFKETIDMTSFDSNMRDTLLKCCRFDWSQVSPAIFGSMFEQVMTPAARRSLGAHYTEEKNILKVINPLFMDDLNSEFTEITKITRENQRILALDKFHDKIRSLKFLDPACGCGNFLIISYRELRRLEHKIIKARDDKSEALNLEFEIRCNVDQFYGIEISEFPSKIAEVAMWLMDHQMNIEAQEEFGQYFIRFPIKESANIHFANALQIDWEGVIPASEVNFILGNPPFIGFNLTNEDQKLDLAKVYENNIRRYGKLDFVCAWFILASKMIDFNNNIKVSFVSTNSIYQGEQPLIIWDYLFNIKKLKIHFAHKNFKWSSEASGSANVFCSIVGFGFNDLNDQYKLYIGKELYTCSNINQYLLPEDSIFIKSRKKTINKNIPQMYFGNTPIDNGQFLLSNNEYENILQNQPELKKFIKPFISSKEFINNKRRWCFWLKDTDPGLIDQFSELIIRINKVKDFRLESNRSETKEMAQFPTIMGEDRQPDSNYLLVPNVSSEHRKYIPNGFFTKDDIVGNSCSFIPDANLYHFGILTSRIHMDWTSCVCGRLKEDFRYSSSIVYNNFPFPEVNSEQQNLIIELSNNILEIRNKFSNNSLAVLYNFATMPSELTKAHNMLDQAVDKLYNPKGFKNSEERLSCLFKMYQKLTENE